MKTRPDSPSYRSLLVLHDLEPPVYRLGLAPIASTYDVGDGYLAEDGKVYPYVAMGSDAPVPLRDVAGKDEEAWAKAKCRKQL